jgi:hypothetical protein
MKSTLLKRFRFLLDLWQTRSGVSIFSPGTRSFNEGLRRQISLYDYLDASARPEAQKVREYIDAMIWRYPWRHRRALRDRIRSKDRITHISACFELQLHELMLRNGYKVLQIEPKMKGTDRRPDFLIQHPSGLQFYLEATLATGKTQAEENAHKNLVAAYHAIDTTKSGPFFLSVEHTGTPTATVSGKKLRRDLLKWLDQLSYEEVKAAWNDNEAAVPVFTYSQNGVEISIKPIPRSNPESAHLDQAIGVEKIALVGGQPHIPIRDALISKASRYGYPDLPLVIAVNALNEFANHKDAIHALLGSSAVHVAGKDDMKGKWVYEADGLWNGPKGKQFTRVSAVLYAERLSPWDAANRRMLFVKNPWAKLPVGEIDFGVDIVAINEKGQTHKTQQKALGEVYGLPDGWPE